MSESFVPLHFHYLLFWCSSHKVSYKLSVHLSPLLYLPDNHHVVVGCQGRMIVASWLAKSFIAQPIIRISQERMLGNVCWENHHMT